METSKKSPTVIQMQFRCSTDLQGMIVQALGATIYKSGKTISKNDFIIHLLKTGLKHQELPET